jgi:hypothetical protein
MKRKREEGEDSLSEDGEERPSKRRQENSWHKVVDIIDGKPIENLDPEEINQLVESAADIEVSTHIHQTHTHTHTLNTHTH